MSRRQKNDFRSLDISKFEPAKEGEAAKHSKQNETSCPTKDFYMKMEYRSLKNYLG